MYICVLLSPSCVCMCACGVCVFILGHKLMILCIHSGLSYILALFVQYLLLLYVWECFRSVKLKYISLYKQNLQRSQACAERQTSRVPSSSWQQCSEVNKSTHIHLNTAVPSRHERKLLCLATIVCAYIHLYAQAMHLEAIKQLWVSFLRDHPPYLLRQGLSELELTNLADQTNPENFPVSTSSVLGL